jgi:putative N6-adenine-specific DNA methylase
MRPGETFPFFTPSVPGLEPWLKYELNTLGLKPLAEEGGFFWRGTWRDLYRANLMLRSAGRILVRMKQFTALSFAEFEAEATSLPWHWFVGGKGTSLKRAFKFKITCTKSKLYHEDALAERLGRWITEATGAGWFPGAADVDAQIFVVRGFHDKFIISADSTGEHLHRRGYRQETSIAPLRETIAASILFASGWVPAVEEGLGRGAATRLKAPTLPLLDPFCGSGTIVAEAALIARKVPPGMANPDLKPRAFAFQRWDSFEPEEFAKTVVSLQNHVLERSPVELRGTDRDEGAIKAALGNARRAGVANDVDFERRTLSEAVFPQPGYLVTNPPFGVRVSEGTDLRDLYAVLGRKVREAPETKVAWLCSEPQWKAATGESWSEAARFPNGGLDLTLLQKLL